MGDRNVKLDLRAIRTTLTEERRRLLAEALSLSEDERALAESRLAESDPGGDQADIASDFVEQEILETLEQSVRTTLRDIEGALARLDGGTYGTCVDCGQAIDPARLKARPWAARCLDCQRRAERQAAR